MTTNTRTFYFTRSNRRWNQIHSRTHMYIIRGLENRMQRACGKAVKEERRKKARGCRERKAGDERDLRFQSNRTFLSLTKEQRADGDTYIKLHIYIATTMGPFVLCSASLITPARVQIPRLRTLRRSLWDRGRTVKVDYATTARGRSTRIRCTELLSHSSLKNTRLWQW